MSSRYLLVGGAIVVATATVFILKQLSSQRGGKSFSVKRQNEPEIPRQSTSASRTLSQSPKPKNAVDSVFMQGLDQAIQKFKHDSLAYFIYEAANEQGLSTSAIEKLFEQYGRYSIKPSFLPYLPNQMESDHRLAAAVSDWLKQKGIESPSSNWEAALEKYIWSSTKTEATKIVSDKKNDTASSV